VSILGDESFALLDALTQSHFGLFSLGYNLRVALAPHRLSSCRHPVAVFAPRWQCRRRAKCASDPTASGAAIAKNRGVNAPRLGRRALDPLGRSMIVKAAHTLRLTYIS
jgi:hypothetical protein